MNVMRIVKTRGLIAAALIGVAWAAPARAQVLDQVPNDALVTIKVKNLQGLSTKVAKLAKDFGVDEMVPQFKDPLGTLMDQGHITKGVNKSGEMAICVYPDGDKKMIALVPVDDYEAFVKNFEPAGPQTGEVREVKTSDGETMFVSQRGKYAALSPDKTLVSAKPTGLKLGAAASKDAAERDAIMFVNVPSIREKALGELRQHRQEAIDSAIKETDADPKAKQFSGVVKVVVGGIFDFADGFLTDCQGVTVSLNINDQGLMLGGVSEFNADSKFGKTISTFKNSDKPLLAGLPDRKYLMYVGMAWDSQAMSKVMTDALAPVNKELAGAGDEGKRISGLLDTMKTMFTSVNRTAAGYVAPDAGDALLQTVSVADGDAKAIVESERTLIKAMTDFMALAGGANNPAAMKVEIKPEAKTVDGVKLDSFSMAFTNPNDPAVMQVQGIMQMVYGPGGMGGVYGAVNDKTFIAVQGSNEKLLADTIASARSQKDSISGTAGVKMVSGQLLKRRSIEGYVALDNIVNSGLNFAQQWGFKVKVKVPSDLPPLGFAGGTEGSAVRGEMFIPSQTVQSLLSAGLQAYQQMQGGPNGGL